MKTFSKVLTAFIALSFFLALAVNGQSPPITLTMELSIRGDSPTVLFEMEGQKISSAAKGFVMQGETIIFATDFQGAEMRFRGKIAGGRMTGTLEAVEKGQRVATGTWDLAKDSQETGNGSVNWKGTVAVRQVPGQQADPDFDVSVARPAYKKRHPKVLFDEAHNNFDTSSGLYKPFADLIAKDGYVLIPNTLKFSALSLKGYEILIVVNAAGPQGRRGDPAFTDEECDAVREWVRGGGSLLFIADHAPFGAAAEILAKRFGVEMSKAYTDDPGSKDRVLGDITFSAENKLLGEGRVTRGRSEKERTAKVVTFTGQSLKGPQGSDTLLTLPASAVDTFPDKSVTAAGRAQGLSIRFGGGRVIVLGEAGMLTAQIDSDGRKFGMNYPGTDNKQFALNIMHWLSRLLK